MMSFAGLFIMNIQLNVQAQIWPISEQRNRKIREVGRMVMNHEPAIRNGSWTIGKKTVSRQFFQQP